MQASGLGGVGAGFFCDPLISVFGAAEGIEDEGEFPMTAGVHLSDEGYMMTDMPLPGASYRALAATALRFDRLFAHARTLTIMVKIRDEIAGRVSPGKARRVFGPSEREKLASGYRRASEILRNAGAKKIFKSRVAAAHPGGTVPIGKHVDTNLQTECQGLYVCDCSVIADPWGMPRFSHSSASRSASRNIWPEWRSRRPACYQPFPPTSWRIVMAREAVIVESVRTALCKANRGSFNMTSPVDQLAHTIKTAVERVKQLDPEEITDVIAGCGMPEGVPGHEHSHGSPRYRPRASRKTVAATTVNRFCSSGSQAIMMAAHEIINEGVDVAIGLPVSRPSR